MFPLKEISRFSLTCDDYRPSRNQRLKKEHKQWLKEMKNAMRDQINMNNQKVGYK